MKKVGHIAPVEHAHECPNPNCRFVWHHDPIALFKSAKANNLTIEQLGEQFDRAHTCPQCGTKQQWACDRIGAVSTCAFDGLHILSELAEVS